MKSYRLSGPTISELLNFSDHPRPVIPKFLPAEHCKLILVGQGTPPELPTKHKRFCHPNCHD